MTSLLTNEEKINIINQHIRNLEFAEYNAHLDILQADAVSASEDVTTEIEDRKNKILTKINVLKQEKDSLSQG